MKLVMRISLAGLAVSFLVGCGGGTAVQVQQERPAFEEPFRRFTGNPARIHYAVRTTIEDLGGIVTDEREGRALQGRVTIGEIPVWLYVRLSGGGRVQVRIYNLDEGETQAFRDRFYDRMDALLGGARG